MTELAPPEKPLTYRLSDEFLHLIIRLFKRQLSAFLIVFGRRGSGKTDFVLLIAELLIELGVVKHVATNIHVPNPPSWLEEIADLDSLRIWARERKGRKLFLFDEIAKAMPRRKPMSSLNVDLLNEFQILRKYKLSVVATTITELQTDSGILDPSIIDGYFLKPAFNRPELADYYDLLANFSIKFDGIPATGIAFDTYSSAPFAKHSPINPTPFSDKDLNTAWQLCNGKKSRELGLTPNQVARLWRKILKPYLEQRITHSQTHARG